MLCLIPSNNLSSSIQTGIIFHCKQQITGDSFSCILIYLFSALGTSFSWLLVMPECVWLKAHAGVSGNALLMGAAIRQPSSLSWRKTWWKHAACQGLIKERSSVYNTTERNSKSLCSAHTAPSVCVCVCVSLFVYLVHSNYQRKWVRTFLKSEDSWDVLTTLRVYLKERLVIMDLARIRVRLMCSVYPEHELKLFISSNRTGNRRFRIQKWIKWCHQRIQKSYIKIHDCLWSSFMWIGN